MKRFIPLLLVLTMLLALVPAVGAAQPLAWTNVYTMTDPAVPNSRVDMQTVDGVNYLFLPEGYSLNNLTLYISCNANVEYYSIYYGGSENLVVRSGEAFDLLALCGDLKTYSLVLYVTVGKETASLPLKIVAMNTGEGIASLFLVSQDPTNQGRAWVESAADKSNKAKGSMLMLSPDGETVYDGALTQIKGRGNTTWAMDKKPYQIKLKSKTDLLQTGNKKNAAKTWVLLANYLDDSALRCQLVYDLSVALGMSPGIECTPVNLFYDGEYRGTYLLCEKVQIGSGRVDITDLEELNEDANPGAELEDLARQTAVTANGATYTYCVGMQTPTDCSGGYLLELDFKDRAVLEACYFVTKRDQYVVVKSPEFASQTEMNYIAEYYQEFEDALFNGGVHPTNGKTLSDYADIESFAEVYLLNELSKNPDSYGSSTFIYKDAGSDILVASPVWDYDLSFGHKWGDNTEKAQVSTGYYVLTVPFAAALKSYPEFHAAVRNIYMYRLLPLLRDTLLGGSKENDSVQYYYAYTLQLGRAAYANGILWGQTFGDWLSECDKLYAYIYERTAWLAGAYGAWEPYVDVAKDAWYYKDVTAATDSGILNGLPGYVFAPEELTTRAQAVKILYALAGAEGYAWQSAFSDVPADAWYAPVLQWGYENGIAKGLDDGTFLPDGNITRQDMVLLLYRYCGSPAVGGDALSAFTDEADIAPYARDAMQWAVANGLIEGYPEGTVLPKANITRAELAALITRYQAKF